MKDKEYNELKKRFMELYKIHKKNDSLFEKIFPIAAFDLKGNTYVLSWDSAKNEISRNTEVGKTTLWILKRKGIL